MKKSIVTIVSFVVLVCSLSAHAHHGFTAHFDPDHVIRIEGTIKEFKFINPHSLLYIDTVNQDGEPITYMCDMQAKSQMLRHGLDGSRFVVGEKIIVEGFQARRDPLQCEYGIGYFADGSSYMLRTIDSAQSQFSESDEATISADEKNTIFRNWIRVGMYGDESGRGPRIGFDSITEAGEIAKQAFDPIADNPVIHCESGSPVFSWGPPGLATSIYQENGNVHIFHESMDITRVIHMNGEPAPEDFEPSNMGYSIGRFEGDSLIIESTNFAAGIIVGSNVNSDQMTMWEEIKVLESGRLHILWKIDDPLYYSEQLTGTQVLQPTNKEILPYNCVPEAEY